MYPSDWGVLWPGYRPGDLQLAAVATGPWLVMTDSKGTSLPEMPEPRSPTTMKQPSDSPGGRKGRGDGSTDPAMLMDKAATQLAATPQESVLQMISSHGHNHTHERLKDLTSRLLNGDQDKIPKLCAATAAQPLLKGVEPVPQHASPPRKTSVSPELTFKITKCVVNLGGKTNHYGADYAEEGTEETNDPMRLSEGFLASSTARRERRKKKRGLVMKTTPPNQRESILNPTASPDQSPLAHSTINSNDLIIEPCVLPTESDEQTDGEIPVSVTASVTPIPIQVPVSDCELSDVAQGVDDEEVSDTEAQPHVQFSVGDVIWTKVSGYPWWPCMITTDPEINMHFRSKVNSRTGLLYHVQYFGNAPEKRYVCENSMIFFSGKHQYQSLSRSNKLPIDISGRKRAIPRKFREHWETGVSQATEALGLIIEERLAKFSFVYENGKAQFNPRMLQELEARRNQGPQQDQDQSESQELVSLTPPDSTHSSPNSTTTTIIPGVFSHPTDSSTSSGKNTLPKKAPKPPAKRDQHGKVLKWKKIELPSAKNVPGSTVQNPCSASATKTGKRAYQKKKDLLCIDLNLHPKAQKKPRQIRQKFPAAPNSVKKRKVKAGVSISDTLSILSTNSGLSDIKVLAASPKVFVEEDVSKGKKIGYKRLRESKDDVALQPKKKTKLEKEFKKQNGQKVCEQPGEDLVICEGQCCGSYHMHCIGLDQSADKVLCTACSSGVHVCFTCKKSEGEIRRCCVLHCGRFYHEACVRLSPLVVFENRGFRCPLHTCLSCHYSGRAAGKATKGGRLLCCESCPAAFHPDCLNIAMPDGSWFCNDCRSGKKPKYRDVIWVKLGNYRWWPAEIRHPKNIPTNIQHLRHEIGEFPVFFFGSKDYFWTHQGRVFPYMEGDRGSKYQHTGIGKVYTADISEIPKCNCKPSDERPCSFESECLNRMLLYECHPQVCPAGDRCQNQDFTKRLYPETKIIRTAGKGWGLVSLRDIKKGEFVNEYVGELIDEEECIARIKYAQENNITHFYMLTIDKDRIIDAGPKGNYSRFMNHSCQPNCETQKWTVNGDTRVGLFAVCDIPSGTELTFNYNLDCLGNEKTVCRCGAPNCSGFLGDRPKNGHASEPKAKHQKKKPKRRKSRNDGKKSEDECFRCGDGGELVLCDKKGCTKAYHLSCLDRTKRPFGRWDCPWHHCDVCGKNSDAFCQLCPNSFCKAHQDGALRSHPLTGQLCCQEHEDSDIRHQAETTMERNAEVPSSTKPRKYRRRTTPATSSKEPLKKRPRKVAKV
ncbi:histone-lysine N-methyltransferase NSD2 [Labeo rohita]|uniref:Histone-lysine N-methyltransferase NSD2 n=1 Tax=Labeo rohita TaxID=84645 RepID=A0A498LTZ4_LABRO|nr:histone-lysine N-methyltransferase NSD2 [Labeo rohita]